MHTQNHAQPSFASIAWDKHRRHISLFNIGRRLKKMSFGVTEPEIESQVGCNKHLTSTYSSCAMFIRSNTDKAVGV